MTNRINRLFHDPSYRMHLRDEARLFARYPRAVGYKGGAMILNQTHQLVRRFRNTQRVRCSVCGWTGNAFESIATFGYLRKNARCPACGALERHRAMIEFLERQQWLQSGDSCLDVGGIPPFQARFAAKGVRYTSMSLGDKALVCANIERLPFADDSFDVLLDAHVLEYVADYQQALREMARVLRSGGKMLLTEAYDFGQPRTTEFGRPNPAATFMVRRFGDDLIGILKDAEFAVTRWDYTGRNDENGDYFFLCEKAKKGERGAKREAASGKQAPNGSSLPAYSLPLALEL